MRALSLALDRRSNIVDVKSLNGSSFMAIASPEVSARIRAWLFVALSFHFGGMIAGIWIMADKFLPPGVCVCVNFYYIEGCFNICGFSPHLFAT